jgi:hypothetical protein
MDEATNRSEVIIIKPALNPDWRPTDNPINIQGLRNSSQVLLEMRGKEER